MKKICILTATRAEYGLLKTIILKLKKDPEFDVRVVVTGAHLSPEFGLTYNEIEQDGNEIDEKIEILLSADTPSAITKSMGMAMIGFADYFKRREPDMLVVLGDRYETLAVCCAAMNQRIPISHLYGGEATEGVIDEAIRHAITKLSFLHFTSTEEYKRRVIQLGEEPNRVFNVGSLGIENVKNEKLLNKSELEKGLYWKLNQPYAVVTFHPVTLEKNSSKKQINEILSAVDKNQQYQYVFTKANSDSSGRIINQIIAEYAMTHKNCRLFDSLGMKKYLSAVKHCKMVIGNSSSGIIEVPSFKVPTINIGDRQMGRIQAESIINCGPNAEEIDHAIKMAETQVFQMKLQSVVNPYEKVDTSKLIVKEIKEILKRKNFEIKKKFYDL